MSISRRGEGRGGERNVREKKNRSPADMVGRDANLVFEKAGPILLGTLESGSQHNKKSPTTREIMGARVLLACEQANKS